MAAAYAALVSLMHLIEQTQHHPHPPVSLDPNQVISLVEKISFLQGFLEDIHSRGISQEMQALEGRIADVAHAAADVIESKGVNQILGVNQGLLASGSTIPHEIGYFGPNDILSLVASGSTIKSETSADFYEDLQRVIQDLELIKKEVMKRPRDKEDNQLPRRPVLHPLGTSLLENTTTMVGFDEIMIQTMDRLAGNQSRRDIIPLEGMGGSGKTTLARNIYEEKLIVEHFDMRSWVTVSPSCVLRQVLIEILLCQRNSKSEEELSAMSEGELGLLVHKSLSGRRYLIVSDDLWGIEAWNELRSFFPDNNNGSRIVITTRLSNLASNLSGSDVVKMNPLDEDTSWDLFCKKVFAEGSRPRELEDIGRRIARNCRGLPLSIVTIGRLLAKSSMTREFWEYVAGNLSSLVNSEDGDSCLRILSLSYNHLPVHLKPCFLYMGLFRENHGVRASYLIRLWVAEGFLKPISGKTLEVVGEVYLKDLVDRNLVSVVERGSTGKIKYCVVHDLLRDLCLRRAHMEKFFSVVGIADLQGYVISNTQRRIAIHIWTSDEQFWSQWSHHPRPYPALSLRSCIIDSEYRSKLIYLKPGQHRLLRILAGARSYTNYDIDDIVPLVNSRFLSFGRVSFEEISLLWSLSWNIQILIVDELKYRSRDTATLDIWKMPRLRHVKCNYDPVHGPIHLPDPELGRPPVVLENLQTLSKIQNFKFSKEVVRRIPNIKKLSLVYDVEGGTSSRGYYCLNNLIYLRNLKSLSIEFRVLESWSTWFDGLTLPRSLEKLTLDGFHLDNEAMGAMIGSLPELQVLRLRQVVFVEHEWSPVVGQFSHLKSLELDMSWCGNLKRWNADSTHFPCLEQIVISHAYSLEEFPSGIGGIPMLRSIELMYVGDSVVLSAKEMLVEQVEEFGNNTLEILVFLREDQGGMKSSASYNFNIYS